MNRVTFRSKYAGETVTLTFDFISLLAIGETISSAVVSSAVYSGAAAATLTCGAAAISGTQVTSLVSGGTEGVTFLVTMTATTSTGQILPLSGFVAITPNAF